MLQLLSKLSKIKTPCPVSLAANWINQAKKLLSLQNHVLAPSSNLDSSWAELTLALINSLPRRHVSYFIVKNRFIPSYPVFGLPTRVRTRKFPTVMEQRRVSYYCDPESRRNLTDRCFYRNSCRFSQCTVCSARGCRRPLRQPPRDPFIPDSTVSRLPIPSCGWAAMESTTLWLIGVSWQRTVVTSRPCSPPPETRTQFRQTVQSCRRLRYQR